MNDYDLIILFSGGADSLLMLKLAKMAGKVPHCLMIDYGQKHVEELEFAKAQLNKEDITWQIVKINGLDVDSGLTGKLAEGRWDNVNEMNVPGRNTIFIGLAISVAENMNIDEVWYGADYEDRINLFPDCYQEYIVKMNEVLAISGVRPIKLVAPLSGMPKKLILGMLDVYFNIRLADVYSGYEPPNPKCACEPPDPHPVSANNKLEIYNERY